jgi:glutathione S-transferase
VRVLAKGEREYRVGPYFIGDSMHFPWLRIAQNIGAEFVTGRPRIVDWLDRIATLPPVERGMAIPEQGITSLSRGHCRAVCAQAAR